MSDNSVYPVSEQLVVPLNRDEAAEAAPKHEDWGEPQEPAEREKNDPEPAYALAAKGQDVVPAV